MSHLNLKIFNLEKKVTTNKKKRTNKYIIKIIWVFFIFIFIIKNSFIYLEVSN